jgi:hypothetical protein
MLLAGHVGWLEWAHRSFSIPFQLIVVDPNQCEHDPVPVIDAPKLPWAP